MAPPPAPVHIALLDDHPLFRQGLRFILQGLPYVAAVEEAAALPALLAICARRLPDVLLLDLQLPGTDGAEVARLLLGQYPGLKIIVLSMFSADTYITQMMKLGARSYLPKDASQEELVQALEAVLATGYHFTPRISRALVRGAQQPVRPAEPAAERLTRREQEIMQLLGEGRTTAEMAAQLDISRRTVEGHVLRMLEKTGARNATGLVVYAVKHGWLTP